MTITEAMSPIGLPALADDYTVVADPNREPLIADDSNWEDLAFCRTEPSATNLFYSEELVDIAAAKRMCMACPVLAPCLEGAIEREEPCGVWGGQLFLNGRIQTKKRRRGRPPKVARPEDDFPEVPIPEHLKPLVA